MAVKKELILELQRIGCVKFGEFRLKSGMVSPIYIDLRILISHPEVLKHVAKELSGIFDKLECDRIAAIPYAALPIGTAVSLEMKKPMVYARRDSKNYGTSALVEGEFRPGETVAVLDDLITTGESKFEVIMPLQAVGMEVKDIVVVIDREQGGKESLEAKGFALHALIKITDMLEVLEKEKKITGEQREKVLSYIESMRA